MATGSTNRDSWTTLCDSWKKKLNKIRRRSVEILFRFRKYCDVMKFLSIGGEGRVRGRSSWHFFHIFTIRINLIHLLWVGDSWRLLKDSRRFSWKISEADWPHLPYWRFPKFFEVSRRFSTILDDSRRFLMILQLTPNTRVRNSFNLKQFRTIQVKLTVDCSSNGKNVCTNSSDFSRRLKEGCTWPLISKSALGAWNLHTRHLNAPHLRFEVCVGIRSSYFQATDMLIWKFFRDSLILSGGGRGRGGNFHFSRPRVSSVWNYVKIFNFLFP